MTDLITVEYTDPVEGDPLYPFASPKDPVTGFFVSGIEADGKLTVLLPDKETVLDLSTTIVEGASVYTGFLDTTDYGGGTYIFRWAWHGPTYFGAVDMKMTVGKSKVVAAGG